MRRIFKKQCWHGEENQPTQPSAALYKRQQCKDLLQNKTKEEQRRGGKGQRGKRLKIVKQSGSAFIRLKLPKPDLGNMDGGAGGVMLVGEVERFLSLLLNLLPVNLKKKLQQVEDKTEKDETNGRRGSKRLPGCHGFWTFLSLRTCIFSDHKKNNLQEEFYFESRPADPRLRADRSV